MRFRLFKGSLTGAILLLLLASNLSTCLAFQSQLSPIDPKEGMKKTPKGFVRLFDGKTTGGWHLDGGHGPGYVPVDNALVVPSDGGGNLYTNKMYSNFVFRFDFRVAKAGNNGIGLRAPGGGDAAYMGMECQVLDDYDPVYANLMPGQYHGSIYRVLPAKRGSTKPAGEWNEEEITAIGRHIKVKVNGQVIVDGDLNSVTDLETLADHPGMLRDKGFIGFLGHGPAEVQFRNIFVKDLSKPEKENTAPKGFTALFNGKNLTGWKGLVKSPPERAKMSAEQLEAAIKSATEEALKHWTVVDGVIVYDGKNDSLCTIKDYRDFEMLVDWKIHPKGDSGIYLRGSPQVQIWDRVEGSGGLYNNQKNPSNPTKNADNPVGQWNRFRIVMVGDKVTVYLNDQLVVHHVTMENYWERNKPMYRTGQLELQHHGDALYFKNIYVREINTKE